MIRFVLFLLAVPLVAQERAAYDVEGRITALLSAGDDLPLATAVVAVLPNNKRIPLRLQRNAFELPDGSRGTLELKHEEDVQGVHYAANITTESAMDVKAIELTLDLPRLTFLNGKAGPVTLGPTKPGSPTVYEAQTAFIHFANATNSIQLDATFDHPIAITLVDRWDTRGRSFQLRATLLKGPIRAGEKCSLTTTLQLTTSQPPPKPAHLTLDSNQPRYAFHGFGGNYCWDTRSAVAAYTMDNLKVAWARSEMKLIEWDKHRNNPSEQLRGDFDMMRRFGRQHIPFVISIWWLPERFYTDAYEQPKSAHNRLIKPEKWDELLELISSYLLHLKREYSVEPDLFSFNESNIGVYVNFTPQTHLEAIKRIGAHFRKQGLKTKMLLGDATGPKDTHKFVLEAASDPEALDYVGAVAFHSWGGGTPERYAAWGDLAEWLKLPLLVTELGVDAQAYHNRAYTSYHYGIEEARMTQELLLYARPQGTQFWQFTNDYSLARTRENQVEPTQRFFLMKHFTDLTPQHSTVMKTASDQPNVLFTAFRKGETYTLHILNTGAAREADLTGLPQANWRMTETTELAPYQSRILQEPAHLMLPAHSLVTLTAAKP
jgi:hypothetical protein